MAPGFNPAIAEASVNEGMPHLPGVATATEIQIALDHGFRWLKAFPAKLLTPLWISSMLAPFPEVRFVATGGIGGSNGGSFLDAGAKAIGVSHSVMTSAAEVQLLMSHGL